MTTTQALKLARDALARALSDDQAYIEKCRAALAAIDALPAAEAQPQGAAEAVETLRRLGHTYEGGELWKPPLGKPPRFAAQPQSDDTLRQIAAAVGLTADDPALLVSAIKTAMQAAHATVAQPQPVNAQMLEAAKDALDELDKIRSQNQGPFHYRAAENLRAAIARAESATQTVDAQPVECERCGHVNWIAEGKAPAQITAADKAVAIARAESAPQRVGLTAWRIARTGAGEIVVAGPPVGPGSVTIPAGDGGSLPLRLLRSLACALLDAGITEGAAK